MEIRPDKDDTPITISMKEMRTDSDDTEIAVSMLYKASKEGSIVILQSLIQKDPLILSKILFFSLSETPLHISAALGHLDFTKELLKLKPKLASELDSHKRSPLHFAAAEGHVEIARALLLENKDVCSVKDQDGRIALHHAAMRGRVDLIQLLISAQHDSVFEVLPSGETALHLCVQHNHLEALRLLVESAGLENPEFLNARDVEYANTILHLAVTLNQVETVEYLLSIPGVKQDTLNHKGSKASDLLDHLPRDFNTLRIQRLMGIDKKQDDRHYKSFSWMSPLIIKRLKHYKREWLKEMRGSIMVVASVIATTTFYAASNPPGGVWQQTTNTTDIAPNTVAFNCEKHVCIAGTSVLAYAWSEDYFKFIRFNSNAFLASLSVILLIIGGFPLRNKVCVWLLTMAMCVTLTFMALTFLQGMYLVTPDHIVQSTTRIYKTSIKIWIGMLALIGAYHTFHFGIWVFKIMRGRDMMIFIRSKWQVRFGGSSGGHP